MVLHVLTHPFLPRRSSDLDPAVRTVGARPDDPGRDLGAVRPPPPDRCAAGARGACGSGAGAGQGTLRAVHRAARPASAARATRARCDRRADPRGGRVHPRSGSRAVTGSGMRRPVAATATERQVRMLRTAMGPVIAAALEDPEVVEVLLNPDGSLWLDRLRTGRERTDVVLPADDAERIIRLVAAHLRLEVHAGAPVVSAELPETRSEEHTSELQSLMRIS